ncbi:MAG: N-acetyltransferase family protein [Rhizobiales bacterium]|nr:N-acetyltransferase family protein [Hyphomicrobiales bacterium]NRB13032.1 N-acetyltransferase family protein [Hyphomicrobiales bacterium]
MPKIDIIPAASGHLLAIKDIYNHYIATTHINFETTPYDDEYMQKWLQQFAQNSRHQAFVALSNGELVGFAMSQAFRPKPAYSTSVEITVYLTQNAAGKGLGKQLGQHLLAILATQDVHRVFACIALPNDASIGLHKSLGFSQTAHLTEVGRKFGNYYDVVYLEYKFD